MRFEPLLEEGQVEAPSNPNPRGSKPPIGWKLSLGQVVAPADLGGALVREGKSRGLGFG